MKILRLFSAVILNLLITFNVFSATRIATSNGRWEQSGTWVGGALPVCGDSIVIGSGITVEVSSLLDFSLCTQLMKLNVTGTLTFQTGKKLKLPCNSIVHLNTGGKITAGKGGGNSNLIDICYATIWNAAMGDLNGPLMLQSNPLPVELVHFSASHEGESVVLNWLTTSELNNDYFVIEKSKNGIDFDELGMMNGAGTSNNINSYKMIDILPFDGIQYYRLSHVDFDKRTNTSDLVAVKWKKGIECSIYPNPTKGELFANIDARFKGQMVHLLINNTDGKLVLSKEINLEESGAGIKLLQLRELLKPGSYLVTLNFKEKSFTQYIVSR